MNYMDRVAKMEKSVKDSKKQDTTTQKDNESSTIEGNIAPVGVNKGHKFKKGESGNPAGRPKDAYISITRAIRHKLKNVLRARKEHI